ncbi:class I SAM-dependent methyltransferase [Pedobacter sp. FW305-3-2-15-E-R2A2]|uniref:class I SAM-dependent methyltransferase n=1 Tax=Pedobacter sp. FW305-3-2-15-E-R2A2 TaxID=3140251 RepID=UPI0031402988
MNQNTLNSLAAKLDSQYQRILEADDENMRVQIVQKIYDEELSLADQHTANNLSLIKDQFLEINDTATAVQYLIQWANAKELAHENSKRRENEDQFDQKYGTLTSTIFEQYELPEDINLERFVNAYRYSPSPVNIVREAMHLLKEHRIDYNKYTFVDIGSGLGRNLLIASEYPFQKITGIEISSYLTEIAKGNLDKYNSPTQKCKDIRLECTDILAYSFPKENMILYFWEPFTADVSGPFMQSLSQFIRETGLTIHLIFLGAVFPAIETSDLFKITEAKKIADSVGVDWALSLYSTNHNSL